MPTLTIGLTATTDLLEELCQHSQNSSAEVLRGPIGEKLAVFEASTAALHFKRVADVLDLSVDFWVIDRKTEKSRRYFACFVHSASHGQPTRGLGQIEQHPHDNEGEE